MSADDLRRDGMFPIRLSELLRVVVGGNSDEARTLELAEQQAQSMVVRHGLIWMVERDDGDPVPRAVDLLTDRIEGTGGVNHYREDKQALANLADLSPQKVAGLYEHVFTCESRAAYYLGLARGWLAAWRVQGGAR